VLLKYKVFYTDEDLPPDQTPNFDLLIPVSVSSVEQAIENALLLIDDGAAVWTIRGPDRFEIPRKTIEVLYQSRRGRPPHT
jgi:hypothetical protein